MASDEGLSTKTTLCKRKDWPSWYNKLQYNCDKRGIWQFIDPEARDSPARPKEPESPKSVEDLLLERDNKLLLAYQVSMEHWNASEEGLEARGPTPSFPTLTVFEDVEKDFRAHHVYFTAQLAFVASYNRKYQPISD
jgi:hypothetical protein